MGKVCVTEDYLQDIADAIREKGVSGTFTPAQMGDAVRQISGGGGIYHLDNKKVAQTNPDMYITTPLDVEMIEGMWYQVNFRDGNTKYTYALKWDGDEEYSLANGWRISITKTVAGLTYYSGAWRNIYCDIIAISEVYPNE